MGPRAPVQVGDRAPDFSLQAANREGIVSLADYHGKLPVLLPIERGLWCAFCRRHIAHLGDTREKLREVGVETLAIVATRPERARLYLRFRPTGVPVAADPELIAAAQSVRINPAGELREPVSVSEAGAILDRLDGFQPTETDRADIQRQYSPGPQLTGQFLVDRGGIIRWVNIECAQEGLAGVGKFPTDEELLAAARALDS